jgi:nicotinamide mononucleotide (NMN) deamidase PncC
MTTQAVLSSTGVLDGSQQGQIATAAQTMINGITAAAVTQFGANTYVGLVSNKGAGYQSPVATVWVGARMDHMESREGDLSEAYVARSLSYTARLIEDRDREIRDLLDQQDREREASDVD